MTKKPDHKASDIYFKPRERFYEFLEQHEILGQKRKKAERKGAVFMAIFFVAIISLAFATHEQASYSLVEKIFG